MLALRLYGADDIRLDEVPIPKINDDEMLLKTEAAAVCGTDIRMWKNGYPGVDSRRPLILGHEFAGEIVEVGKNVHAYRAGEKAAVAPNIGCGICDRCVSGNPHLCGEYRAFGINMDGAFAEYVKIPKDAVVYGNVMRLPEGVTPAEAALNEPLSCVYNGFLKCGIRPGDNALIVGAGPIGIMHAMLAQMAGAAKVMIHDVSEERLLECKKILPESIVYHGENLADFVDGQTRGRGLDAAVTACPVPSVQSAMLPLMNYGGRVNFFGGIPASQQPVAIDTNIVHYKELILTGSTRSSIAQFRKTLELVSDGLIPIARMITEYFPMPRILEAFSAAASAKGLKNIITFED